VAYEDADAFGRILAAESSKWRELFKTMPPATEQRQ
jgi:hypothetical protein